MSGALSHGLAIQQAGCRNAPSANAKYRIDCIVGTRPNFVKIAPIMRALKTRSQLSTRLIHTGQHYDPAMSGVFFEELAIPQPDMNLVIGPGTLTEQSAQIMLRLESVFSDRRPDLVVVVGDVNSTAAATYVASQLRIPIAHIEAGLRSFDLEMPEEINRLLTDRLATLLFTTEYAATANLIKEGIANDRIKFVGNVMIDTLYHCLRRAVPARQSFRTMAAGETFVAAAARGFGLITLHRPSNVDNPARLAQHLHSAREIAQHVPLVFPLHPRTGSRIIQAGLDHLLIHERILTTEPLGYLSMLGLMRAAKFVITDSGGVQEETTALGVPCLTVRASTERPITVTCGTNTLIPASSAALTAAVATILKSGGKRGNIPPLWDGCTAERIAEEIESFLTGSVPASAACAA